MARTAPAPNIPPIPGMCPSIAVLAGGGDGGGGSGDGAGDGSGDNHAGTGKDGQNAENDGRGAPDYQKYPECGYASHPVDVVTGRAFTHPILDLELPGPLPLRFERMYSSKMAARDVGLGFGWGHTFGWEIEVERRRILVWNEQGVAVVFPMIRQGEEVVGPWGWVLRREAWGFAVDADDGVWHLFSAEEDGGKRFRLTAVEDRNRNRIALTYEDGKLVEVKDSAGRIIRVVSTREGRIGSIQVQNAVSQGRWVAFGTYAYDERGDLVSATDADGHVARYAYDEDHRLTLDQDRAGLTFHFVYDREGRCVESWGDYPGKRDPSLADDLPKYLADGKTRAKGIHHCRFEYGADGYSEVADSTQVRRYFGTRHGTLSKSVEGPGVMTAAYRDDGHLLARADGMGGRRSFERDARGRVLKLTDEIGRVTVYERDPNGLVVAMIDPAGGVTSAERDARGNLCILTDAAGGVSSYRCDERGLLLEVASPSGGRTKCTYDAQGNRVSLTEANGAAWRYSYDALGRRASRIDPTGAERRYIYSARGDLVEERDALGGVTRYTYDGERHLTQVVDPGQRVTQFIWGGYHKMSERRDASGDAVRLRYDLEGQLVEVHDERGQIHRLSYSPGGLLAGEVTIDGRALRNRHDLAGRVVKIEDGARGATVFEHDLAGQLLKRELPDGSAETFEYDLRGDLVTACGPGCEVRFERDALGRVVREVQSVGGEEHTVEVSYDHDGERIGRQTSLGHSEVVTRGPLGERLRTLLDGTHAVEHRADPFGQESARALPGGGWLQTQRDALGRVTRQRAGGASSARGLAGEPSWIGELPDGLTVDVAYRYSEAGDLVEAWDHPRAHTEYTYDPVGQLLSMVPEKARAEVFRYDAAGNVHESGPGAEARVYEDNRLRRKGDTEYAWDANGRLAEERGPDGVVRYVWSGAGRLAAVERPDGVRVDFVYDPLARRVRKRVTRPGASAAQRRPVSETRFVWDGDVLVHAIEVRADDGGDPIVEERTYCFEDDGFAPVAQRVRRAGEERGEWLHYLNDPAGAPARLLGGDGAVAADVERTAWGETRLGGRASTPIRFQGQYEDSETGLCYNRYRYYDPSVGRFISPDPAGLDGGTNDQRAPRNVITWIDPLGLGPKEAQRAVERGQGPSDIGRIDAPEQSVPGSQWHAHQKKCVKGKHPALNLDGTSHDGTPTFSKKTRKWLASHGWNC